MVTSAHLSQSCPLDSEEDLWLSQPSRSHLLPILCPGKPPAMYISSTDLCTYFSASNTLAEPILSCPSKLNPVTLPPESQPWEQSLFFCAFIILFAYFHCSIWHTLSYICPIYLFPFCWSHISLQHCKVFRCIISHHTHDQTSSHHLPSTNCSHQPLPFSPFPTIILLSDSKCFTLTQFSLPFISNQSLSIFPAQLNSDKY